jgi:hypothetical protein
MSTFEARSKPHDLACSYLESLFKHRGYTYAKYGIEHKDVKEIHNKLMDCTLKNNDQTSKFVRHLPDYICIINDKVYFFDMKTQVRIDTPNYSIECDALEILQYLMQYKCLVVLIFSSDNIHPKNKLEEMLQQKPPNFKACLLNEIGQENFKKNINPERSKGSNTPFFLILKSTKGIVDFNILMDRLEVH